MYPYFSFIYLLAHVSIFFRGKATHFIGKLITHSDQAVSRLAFNCKSMKTCTGRCYLIYRNYIRHTTIQHQQLGFKSEIN